MNHRGKLLPTDYSNPFISDAMVCCHLCGDRTSLRLREGRFECRDDDRCQQRQSFGTK